MRYIDADKLSLHKFVDCEKILDNDMQRGYQRGYNDAIDSVVQFEPTADVRENVRGEWLTKDGRASWIECSVCEWHGYILGHIYHYCPNCGADMRGGKNE